MDITSYTGSYIQKKNHHLYIAPDPALADMIAHYTITFASGIEAECEQYHIMPDASGCFIFQQERMDFWGAMSEMVILDNDVEIATERLFVEFLPGGLYQTSGKPQHAYMNQRAPLQDFDLDIQVSLQKLLSTCSTYDEAIANLNAWFMERRSSFKIPQPFQQIIHTIDEQNGDVVIQAIAQQHAISKRQLLRLFQKYIGLSAKEYANVVRFNCLLKQLKEDDFLQTALTGGFFDQAHFNKMFKQITHTTPSHYIKNLTEFYRELFKF